MALSKNNRFIEANRDKINAIREYKGKDCFYASEVACLPCFDGMSLQGVTGFLRRGCDRGVFRQVRDVYKRGRKIWLYCLMDHV